MEKYRIKSLIGSIMFYSILSCGSEPDPLPSNQEMITRLWKYEYIFSDGDTVAGLSNDFHVLDTAFLPFFRVSTRGIYYTEDNLYQFRWSFIGLQQSYGTGLNFQPNGGTYDLTNNGKQLIHNSALQYEVVYDILELTPHRMVRTSHHFDELKQEWVTWTEVLVSQPSE